MRTVVCRNCAAAVDVPDDLAHPHCVRCGHALADTHISSSLPPPLSSPAFQPEPFVERAPLDSRAPVERPERYTTWDEFRSTSPVVQQELTQLAGQVLPDLRRVYVLPLPETVPTELDGWSKPVGTIEGAGDDWPYFYFVSCSVMFIGVLMTLGSMVTMADHFMGQRGKMGPAELFGMSVVAWGVLGWSIWYMFVRGRKFPYTLWVFDEGLLWSMGRQISGVYWEDVHDYRVSNHLPTGMPALSVVVNQQTRFAISVEQAPALMPLLEFMETRLTAAQFLPRLKSLFEGNRESFGIVVLDHAGFASPKLHAPWSAIERVVRDRWRLYVHLKNRTDWHPISYSAVAFPLLVMTLAHIMIEEHDRLPPVAG